MTEPIIWENRRLEVIRELGKGACAIVHLVKHEGNKRYDFKKPFYDVKFNLNLLHSVVFTL